MKEAAQFSPIPFINKPRGEEDPRVGERDRTMISPPDFTPGLLEKSEQLNPLSPSLCRER